MITLDMATMSLVMGALTIALGLAILVIVVQHWLKADHLRRAHAQSEDIVATRTAALTAHLTGAPQAANATLPFPATVSRETGTQASGVVGTSHLLPWLATRSQIAVGARHPTD
ncbi:MAG: hypothetical protein ACM31L_10500 [Actinomycetota bacterium]